MTRYKLENEKKKLEQKERSINRFRHYSKPTVNRFLFILLFLSIILLMSNVDGFITIWYMVYNRTSKTSTSKSSCEQPEYNQIIWFE